MSTGGFRKRVKLAEIKYMKEKIKFKNGLVTTIQRNTFRNQKKWTYNFACKKRHYVPIVQYKPCTHFTNLHGVNLTLIYTSSKKKKKKKN